MHCAHLLRGRLYDSCTKAGKGWPTRADVGNLGKFERLVAGEVMAPFPNLRPVLPPHKKKARDSDVPRDLQSARSITQQLLII